MKIAILHYHFDRGGVTRVVSSTLEAFRNRTDYEFGLLSGRPVTELDTPSRLIPGLNYSSSAENNPAPDELYRQVTEAARDLFDGEEPDVWHIHNPALGKNTSFTGLVNRLAADGQALLLHEHDFAEDFRPANFRLRESSRDDKDSPFPYSPRVRFAVLNQRDADILQKVGLPSSCLAQLPNPVPPAETVAPLNPDSDLILYPVRALARKNLGEFLLLAHALGGDFRWETTLPPTNPAYQKRFQQWCDLVEDLGLPARLGVAASEDRPFAERLAESRAVVTTSVAEGFGLSFLEPWTYGRPVFGRDLPEITREFRDQGIPLDSLYSRFLIPAEATDPEEVARRWEAGIRSAYESFATKAPEENLSQTARQIAESPLIDFSLLGEDLQAQCLRTVVAKKIPIEAPTAIPSLDADGIDSRREPILQTFSPEAYAAKLETLYHSLVDAPAEKLSSLSPEEILREFLHPNRFHPHFVE